VSTRYYVPRDTTALAVGAEAVAQAISDLGSSDAEIVRNGSRGAFWLEPLLEIESEGVRVGFGPVSASDVAGILAISASDYATHPCYLGPLETHDWFTGQHRLTFARAGLDDPLSMEGYIARRGFDGFKRAITLTPSEIVEEVTRSGLRGRGGAAFPAGIKWRTVLEAGHGQKYIVCNADEGDSGTFADRLLMEADPYQLIEGMLIAGLAVGADRGYIYLRSEYPKTQEIIRAAIARAESAGYLGDGICGTDMRFSIELRLGAGAYICGEETALLESLEGRRGMVRAKPPLPALKGLFSKPTVVNNVLTLAAVTTVMAEGAQTYAALGSGRSLGTLTLQLAGNVRRGGLIEVPYGVTLSQVLEEYAGGTRSGRPMRAVQVGGPLGSYLPEAQWDTPLDYEAFAGAGAMLGHGGVVVFDDSVDMAAQARFAFEFCALESCGKCTPCRAGSVRGAEIIDRIIARDVSGPSEEHFALLEDLCHTMEHGSLCAMGGLTPMPVRSAIKFFPEDFS